MFEVTCVLFKPNRRRRDPRLPRYVVSGECPTKMIVAGPEQRQSIIDRLEEAARIHCVQPDPNDHSCLTFDIRHDFEYVDMTVIYMRDCLYTTDHVMSFLHYAESILNQVRIETIRALTRC